MKKEYRQLIPLLAALFSVACVDSARQEVIEERTSSGTDLILCDEPRPQICTREYNPVCAILNDGHKDTRSTGCTACSDSAVSGYRMGEC